MPKFKKIKENNDNNNNTQFPTTLEKWNPISIHFTSSYESFELFKYFLLAAPSNFNGEQSMLRFPLFDGTFISCIYYHTHFLITGTDILRSLLFRFEMMGLQISNIKKFEEGVFSDLRHLKKGEHAILEEPRSELLERLYRANAVRTQKKQKLFFWYEVMHDKLFKDALLREKRRFLVNRKLIINEKEEINYDKSLELEWHWTEQKITPFLIGDLASIQFNEDLINNSNNSNNNNLLNSNDYQKLLNNPSKDYSIQLNQTSNSLNLIHQQQYTNTNNTKNTTNSILPILSQSQVVISNQLQPTIVQSPEQYYYSNFEDSNLNPQTQLNSYHLNYNELEHVIPFNKCSNSYNLLFQNNNNNNNNNYPNYKQNDITNLNEATLLNSSISNHYEHSLNYNYYNHSSIYSTSTLNHNTTYNNNSTNYYYSYSYPNVSVPINNSIDTNSKDLIHYNLQEENSKILKPFNNSTIFSNKQESILLNDDNSILDSTIFK